MLRATLLVNEQASKVISPWLFACVKLPFCVLLIVYMITCLPMEKYTLTKVSVRAQMASFVPEQCVKLS